MVKIKEYLHDGKGVAVQVCANMEKLNEIIDHLSLLDKLAKRVARLELYYRQHRKEHERTRKTEKDS